MGNCNGNLHDNMYTKIIKYTKKNNIKLVRKEIINLSKITSKIKKIDFDNLYYELTCLNSDTSANALFECFHTFNNRYLYINLINKKIKIFNKTVNDVLTNDEKNTLLRKAIKLDLHIIVKKLIDNISIGNSYLKKLIIYAFDGKRKKSLHILLAYSGLNYCPHNK